jgi:hypothetical protein
MHGDAAVKPPLQQLADLLETSPRDREFLAVDVARFPEEERGAAIDMMLAAANSGDARVPSMLRSFMGPERGEVAMRQLLLHGPPLVAVAAAAELRNLLLQTVVGRVGADLERGAFTPSERRRPVDAILGAGGFDWLAALMLRTEDEILRTVIIDVLWDARGLSQVPTVWWRGLGLLKRTLELPVASFRTPVLDVFARLLRSTPQASGFGAVAPGPLPPELRTAMARVDKAVAGADATVDSLEPELRRALLVYAAGQVLKFSKPNAISWVVHLGGAVHRDVLAWAAEHPVGAMRVAAAAFAGANSGG